MIRTKIGLAGAAEMYDEGKRLHDLYLSSGDEVTSRLTLRDAAEDAVLYLNTYWADAGTSVAEHLNYTIKTKKATFLKKHPTAITAVWMEHPLRRMYDDETRANWACEEGNSMLNTVLRPPK